jgi:predicted Zn-dependent protease
MRTRRLPALVVLALVGVSSGNDALASPPRHIKRSKSDADINAIGHRRIERDRNFFSPGQEKELGKSISLRVEQTAKLIRDPVIMDYVGRVAQNVAKNSDAHFPVTVSVIDSDTENAFTLPGGYQYISRGLLLRLEGEAELASVLARGIAHTALRSATREATKSELAQLAIIPLLPMGTTPGGVAFLTPLLEMNNQREDEMDADYFGVQYLYKAGYDTKCFTDFVQRAWDTSSTAGEKLPKISSAFPPLDERLAALHKEISEILPPRVNDIVSTPEFDAFKERLRTLKPEGPEPKPPAGKTAP